MSTVKTYAYTVCPENRIGENDRFWVACGLDSLYPLIDTEGGEFLMKRMKEHGTCRYMRNHHTLSRLCKDGFPDAGGNVYSEDENGKRQYHFEKINGILKRYLDYGIKSVVELDFLPDELSARKMRGGVEEGVYDNRSYPTDWGKWQELLNAFVRNLAVTFGREEVRNWYFEVRGLFTGGHVMKPIGTAHELLALMGDELLEVRGDKSGGPVGCMAAKSPEGIQLLLYHVNESDPEGELPSVNIEAAVSGIEKTGYTIRVICIDRKHHNTYRKWLELATGNGRTCDTPAGIRRFSYQGT